MMPLLGPRMVATKRETKSNASEPRTYRGNTVDIEHLRANEHLDCNELIDAAEPDLRKFIIVTIPIWKEPRESNEVHENSKSQRARKDPD
jgi:hypothetical protein